MLKRNNNYLKSAESLFSIMKVERAKFNENSMFTIFKEVRGPLKFLMMLKRAALNSLN